MSLSTPSTSSTLITFPAGNYMFEVNSGNTRTKSEKMFKINNKDNNGVVLVSLLLTLNIFHT